MIANFIDFEKNIFENAWLLSKFSKIKPFKNFPLYYFLLHYYMSDLLREILQLGACPNQEEEQLVTMTSYNDSYWGFEVTIG